LSRSTGSRLIVNADDFGFTRNVNRGILHAHQHGILSATTLMANGDAFDDAVQLALATPSLDVGCHLVLIQGRSLVSGRDLPGTWNELTRVLLMRQLDVYSELRAQVQRIVDTGIKPSHLDTHKHTHVLPNVLSAVMRLAQEFAAPFIRLPFDAGWWPARPVDAWYRRRVREAQLRTTDHFLGFRLTDTLNERSLLAALSELPEGSTEFMCHPGYFGEDLRRAATRLKETRERELEALVSPRIKEIIAARQIVLTNYRVLLAGA
jgi:predicted glycoside hydrolase/deacetylase ChbG (UPF0249 family)